MTIMRPPRNPARTTSTMRPSMATEESSRRGRFEGDAADGRRHPGARAEHRDHRVPAHRPDAVAEHRGREQDEDEQGYGDARVTDEEDGPGEGGTAEEAEQRPEEPGHDLLGRDGAQRLLGPRHRVTVERPRTPPTA